MKNDEAEKACKTIGDDTKDREINSSIAVPLEWLLELQADNKTSGPCGHISGLTQPCEKGCTLCPRIEQLLKRDHKGVMDEAARRNAKATTAGLLCSFAHQKLADGQKM